MIVSRGVDYVLHQMKMSVVRIIKHGVTRWALKKLNFFPFSVKICE